MAVVAPLRFDGFKVLKLVFEREDGFNEGEFELNVQYLAQPVSPEDRLTFFVLFIITITAVKNQFTTQIQARGDFKILGTVDAPVFDNYTKISAPSILYPYIRAYVSNLFLQSGMKAIVLPPLNFGIKNNPGHLESHKVSTK